VGLSTTAGGVGCVYGRSGRRRGHLSRSDARTVPHEDRHCRRSHSERDRTLVPSPHAPTPPGLARDRSAEAV